MAAAPPGIAARLVEFCEELRSEGVAAGTSELLDGFAVLDAVAWTDPEDFRAALSATLAKSPEDRRIFELVFDRFFFRAAEAAAVEVGVKESEGATGSGADFDEMNLDTLRQQIAAALRDGSEAALRDLARLAIAAFGRQGEGSGVIGVRSACAPSPSPTSTRTIPVVTGYRVTSSAASRSCCAASSSASRSSARRRCLPSGRSTSSTARCRAARSRTSRPCTAS
jgi:uncharacterized protein with von Willebrand factor type A (vWA) domain